MIFVKALEENIWRTPLKQLVRCRVDAKWCVDGVSVDVEPGLVVGFSKDEDADYFLTIHGRKEEPRCELVYVLPDDIVAFNDPKDAQHFIDRGKAKAMTEAEVLEAMQALAERQASGTAVAPVERNDDGDVVHTDTQPASAPAVKKNRRGKA